MPYFFSCKQVSRYLAKEDYEHLSGLQKLSLKTHVLLCPICGVYNRQVMKFQDMVRTFRKHKEAELNADHPNAPRLRDTSRDRIKAAMRDADNPHSPRGLDNEGRPPPTS